jgi:outer membrane protein assembly factor BamB
VRDAAAVTVTTRARLRGSVTGIVLSTIVLWAGSPVVVGAPAALAAGPAPRNARLVSFDARTGKRRWARGLDVAVGVSAVASNGRLFVTGQASCGSSSRTRLVVLDAGDGRTRWRAALGHELIGPYAAGGTLVLAGARPSTIDGFDAATGKRRWHTPFASGSTLSASGPVLVASSTTGAAATLTRYDVRTGVKRWSASLPESPQPILLAPGPTAVFVVRRPARPPAPGQTLLDAPPSVLTAIDAGDGRTRWEQPVDAVPTGAGVLTVGRTAVVPQFSSHTVVAFDAATGHELWRQPTPDGTVDVESGDGNLYTLTPTELRATDPATGALRWTAPDGSSSIPLVTGSGVVAVLSTQAGGEPGVTVLDAHDGHLLWRRGGSLAVDGGPLVAASGQLTFVETHTSCGD